MMRMFEHSKSNRNVVIASNYILAAGLGFMLSKKSSLPWEVYVIAGILGLIFFVAFIVYGKAIKSEGVAGAVTMGRLSLALPVGISIFFWGEKPLLVDILGLVLIFVILFSWEGRIGKLSPVLFSLFFLFGVNDTLMKYFKMRYPGLDNNFFLVVVFLSALAWSWLYVLVKREGVDIRDVGRGLLLGVPNFGATIFLLLALETVPAYVVFPFINVGVIILSAVLGYVFFKERLNRKRVFLVGLGVVAVFLLTVTP